VVTRVLKRRILDALESSSQAYNSKGAGVYDCKCFKEKPEVNDKETPFAV
jgi:hypothetical protein